MGMTTEIRVPTLGESVSEATIGRWFKKPGDALKADEPLVELETDKVTLEVNAPAAGTLGDIAAKDGETVTPGALLSSIVEGAAATALAAGAKPAPAPKAAGQRSAHANLGCRLQQSRRSPPERAGRLGEAQPTHRRARPGCAYACTRSRPCARAGARALCAGRCGP